MRRNLDKKVGPLTLRAYGLLLNFIANAVALVGISRVLAGSGGEVLAAMGAGLTVFLIVILSHPSQDDPDETHGADGAIEIPARTQKGPKLKH